VLIHSTPGIPIIILKINLHNFQVNSPFFKL